MEKYFIQILTFSLIITVTTKIINFYYIQYLLHSRMVLGGNNLQYLCVALSAFLNSTANPLSGYFQFSDAYSSHSRLIFFSYLSLFDFAFWAGITSIVFIYKKEKIFGIPFCGILAILIGNNLIWGMNLYLSKKSLMSSPKLMTFFIFIDGIILIISGIGLLLWKRRSVIFSLVGFIALGATYLLKAINERQLIEQRGLNNIPHKVLSFYYADLAFFVVIAAIIYYLTRPKVKEQLK